MIADLIPQLREAVPVIISLIIIEGLLSVDNMLAIAALASGLPEKQKKIALRMGLAGAYVFRGVALAFAGFIRDHTWIKFLGAFYLIHLMAVHFSDYAAEHDENPETHAVKPRTFWGAVVAIQLMDLSLSVDNVVTAVAMSPKLWVIYTGVCLGLLTLWLFATISLKLVEKYPILQHTAFILIGYVGMVLLGELSAEYFLHVTLHVGPGTKFAGIASILAFSVWYSRNGLVRQRALPFLRIANFLMTIYSKISGTIFGALSWPIRAIGSRFRSSRAA